MLTLYCRVLDSEIFNRLVSKVDTKYVDFIINGTVASIVSMDSELFISLNMTLDFGSSTDELISFRVGVDEIKHILYDGVLVIEVGGNYISLTGTNSETKCSIEYKFDRQVSYFSNVIGILSELREVITSPDRDSLRTNLCDLDSLYKINKYLKGNITVSDNLAYIIDKSYMIYKRCKCDNFCLSYSAFNFILDITVTPINYKNKFIFYQGGVLGYAIKSKNSDVIDFDFIESKKSTFKCNIDFSNVSGIYKTLKWKECYCVIDLDGKMLEICNSISNFKFPVLIKNENILAKIKTEKIDLEKLSLDFDDNVVLEDTKKLPRIKLSKELIFKIVPILSSGNKILELELKKDFAIFRSDVNILFRRMK